MVAKFLHVDTKKIAFIAVGGFFVFSMLWCMFGFRPDYTFVGLSFILSCIFLFLSSFGRRVAYVELYLLFTILLWFFSPFIRRLGDYHNGWSDLNVYGLAPILSTLVSVFFLNKKILNTKEFVFFFLIMFLSLTYSLVVGGIRNGVSSALYDYLTWICPIFILLYIVSNYEWVYNIADTLLNAAILGVIVLGVYGVYQYFFLPPWDALWIINAPITSVGAPFPMQFRSFSMSNAPMVYAPILAMLLLIIISKLRTSSYFFISIGLVSLALTFVRAAWVGFALGLILYIAWLSRRNILKVGKIFFASLFIGIFLVISLNGTEVGYVLWERIDTIFSLDDDVSYNARNEFYSEMLNYAITNFFGDGMGSTGQSQTLSKGDNVDTVFDNGFLELFIVLGWVGVFLYAFPLFYFIKRCWSAYLLNKNFTVVMHSIIFLSGFAQMIFSNRFVGPIGFFIFVSLAVVISFSYKTNHLGSGE